MSKVLYRQNMREDMRYMVVWFNMHRAAHDQRNGVNQQYDEVTAENINRTDIKISEPTKSQLELPCEFNQLQSFDGRDV